MDMDVIQLIIWTVVGLITTWGIFLAWVGFRNVPSYSKRRLARTASTFTFTIGVLWIMLWVSAVVFNIFQIFGGITWHLM